MLGLLRHRRVAGLLSSYIDGQVTSAERRLIEEHLPGCDRCSRDLDDLRRTVSLMGALPELDPGRSYALSSAHLPAPARRSAIPLWAPGIAAAACAVLLVVVISGQAAGVLVQSRGFGQESESYADAPSATAAQGMMAFDEMTSETSLLAEAIEDEAMSDELAGFQESAEPELMETSASDFEAAIESEAMQEMAAEESEEGMAFEMQADVAAAEVDDSQAQLESADAAEKLEEPLEDADTLARAAIEDPAEPDSEPLELPLWQIQLGAGLAFVAFAIVALAFALIRRLRRTVP